MNLEYRHSESTNKPNEIEKCKTTVYLRKNITKVIRTDENNNEITFWVYDEAKMSLNEFEEYSKLMEAKKALNDENQMIIMEAIADLYDTISNIQGGTT